MPKMNGHAKKQVTIPYVTKKSKSKQTDSNKLKNGDKGLD